MQTTSDSKPTPSRIVEEIFSRPIDLFDFFFENHFHTYHYLILYISFALIGVASKLLLNFILIQIPENVPMQLTEGLLVPVFLYGTSILGIFFLEGFVKTFLTHVGKQSKKYFGFIAFLPLAATSVFFLLPKPFFILGLLLGVGVGIYNFFNGLKYLYELNSKQLINFLFAIGIFIGFLSYLFLLTINLYKNWN